MRRREFLGLVGGAATAWPLAAHAQQSDVPVVGFLSNSWPNLHVPILRAFREGLSESGFIEGRNITIEYRYAEGRNERMPEIAADLVRRRVAAIAAAGITAATTAKAATTAIPIVFSMGADPVERGLVASLSRPGGNLTGVSNMNVELGPKRLELIRETVPAATSMALLVNASNRVTEPLTKDVQAAARAVGVRLDVVPANNEREFEAAFASLRQLQTGALVISNDGIFINRAEELGALSARNAIPAIFQSREFALAGGLLSYGGSANDDYRLVGVYIGRILKGAKPSELPVQRSSKSELIVNLKTAKALNVTVPLNLLGRADEVIE